MYSGRIVKGKSLRDSVWDTIEGRFSKKKFSASDIHRILKQIRPHQEGLYHSIGAYLCSFCSNGWLERVDYGVYQMRSPGWRKTASPWGNTKFKKEDIVEPLLTVSTEYVVVTQEFLVPNELYARRRFMGEVPPEVFITHTKARPAILGVDYEEIKTIVPKM